MATKTFLISIRLLVIYVLKNTEKEVRKKYMK